MSAHKGVGEVTLQNVATSTEGGLKGNKLCYCV